MSVQDITITLGIVFAVGILLNGLWFVHIWMRGFRAAISDALKLAGLLEGTPEENAKTELILAEFKRQRVQRMTVRDMLAHDEAYQAQLKAQAENNGN